MRLGYADARQVQRALAGRASGPFRRKFFQLAGLAAAGEPAGGDGAGDPDAVTPGDEGGEDRPHDPLGSGDLPPVAERPPAEADDDESLLQQIRSGGKTVTVRSLGRYGRLEVSLLVFFSGKDIEYRRPLASGDYAVDTVHQPGLADFLPDPRDAAVIRDHAPEMAHAWADWARTNPRVAAFLGFLALEGGFKGVVAATMPVILAVLANHGVDPVAFFFRPLELARGNANGDSADTGERPGFPGPFGFDNVEGGLDS